jgi:hypothetical protein
MPPRTPDEPLRPPPLTIAAATAATEHGQAALTFDGAEKLTIPPGEEAAGDPMDLPVAPGADLFLSLYFPEETGLPPIPTSLWRPLT